VEGPRQVHEEDDRDTGLRAEIAVGEIHATGRDGTGGCVLVGRGHAALGRSVVTHGSLLLSRSGSWFELGLRPACDLSGAGFSLIDALLFLLCGGRVEACGRKTIGLP